MPSRVHTEMRRYLQCGDLRHGFVQVKCGTCSESTLVAFSCKGRGFCPSCGARRAHETALHLMEALPQVDFRQWTLSLPGTLRWPLVKDAALLRAVERQLVRAIFWVFSQLFGATFETSSWQPLAVGGSSTTWPFFTFGPGAARTTAFYLSVWFRTVPGLQPNWLEP